MFVHRPQNLVRRKPHDHARRTVDPAHDPTPVNEDRRGHVGIAPVRTDIFVNEFSRLGQPPSLVREDAQVREVGLRLAGQFDPFDGDRDHASVTLREFFMASFELDQLGHADGSPSTAEEDEREILIAYQIVLGED
jgi:hypothetical protein